jgi:NADH:ubiquinone oxidoreductase subunit K
VADRATMGMLTLDKLAGKAHITVDTMTLEPISFEVFGGHYDGSIVFTLGAVGFLMRRNALIVLMSIELMLNAANLALVAFNRYAAFGHAGQAFALFVVSIGIGLRQIVFCKIIHYRVTHDCISRTCSSMKSSN